MYQNYRLFIIFLLTFCFFCWGCQQEDLQSVEKAPEQSISFKERTFEEVTSIPAIKEILEGEEKKGQVDLKTAENGSTLLEQEHNFTIDRSRIIEIMNNGLTSFTMAVQRDYDTPGYFENLMIDVDSEQEVNAYLIRYTPNEEIQDFPAHQTFSFHGKISVVPIQFVGSIAEYEKKHQKASETICGSTPILICSYGSYDHIAGDECIKQESRTNDGRVTTAWIPNDCNDGGGVLYDGSSYPTNEGIHESGSDGSSTGTTTPIINEDDDAATALTNILELTDQSTIDWLSGHMTIAQEICDFLNSNKQSEESKDYADALIYAKRTNLYSQFFQYDLFSRDPYGVWKELSQAEKDLIIDFPLDAYILWKNRAIAEQATVSKFNVNGRNDRSDAFRHAYYNAINTMKIGAYMAEKFSTAHESEVPALLALEKQMDLFNNNQGHKSQIEFPNHTNHELVNDIYLKVVNGALKYLSPLDIVAPPYNGINSNTQLIPTNQ